MKKKTIAICLLLCLALSPAFALAASTMRVSGNATLTVAPDRAKLDVGFSADNADAQQAQRKVADTIDAIQKAVIAAGVAEENIKTSNLYTYPIFGSGSLSNETSYRVEHMLSIRIEDLSQTGAVLDAALSAGANQGGNISYSASNEEEVYLEALAVAVENAKHKANALAIASGVWLGQLEQVNEQSGGSYTPYFGRGMGVEKAAMDAAGQSMGDTLMVGDIEITASVELVYAVR